MVKRILINHPERMARKVNLLNARQKLEGKSIKELKQDDLVELIQYLAGELGCIKSDGTLKFN